MKRARNPLLPLLRAAALLALGSVWAVACAGPQDLGGAGSVCFRTDDCKEGLACVPSAKGSSKSICSADLTLIVSMVDGAPPDSAAPMGDAAAGTGGGPAGGAGGAPIVSAGAGGKPATGGAAGSAAAGAGGKASGGAGGKASGGAPAGGAPGGGAPAGGMGTAGTGTAGTGTAGTSPGGGGTGGTEPVDAGDG